MLMSPTAGTFVNVQWISSPASIRIVALRFETSPLLLPSGSVHSMSLIRQPSWGSWLTRYCPGVT